MGNFYNGGLCGKSLSFVGSSWNFVLGYIKKRWHTSWKFQLEIKSNKKVIAKKSLTNIYEMNSRVYASNFWFHNPYSYLDKYRVPCTCVCRCSNCRLLRDTYTCTCTQYGTAWTKPEILSLYGVPKGSKVYFSAWARKVRGRARNFVVELKMFVLEHKLCALAWSSSCSSTNISCSDMIEFVLEHEYLSEHELDHARAQSLCPSLNI